MALPEGIETCTVTSGVPVTFGGAPVKAFVSVEPSVYLVHTATGTPLVDFLEEQSVTEGVAAQFTLPVDQDGFQDENGNAYRGWFYTARITYSTTSKAKNKTPKVKVFQLVTGQTLVDLDTLPGGVPALPYTGPVAGVTSVNGQTGAVLVAAELPARLEEAALDATIAEATAPKLDKTEAATTYAVPRGNRVVFLGDSTMQGAASDAPINGATTRRLSNSWPVYASVMSNQRIRIAKHSGIWGNTTAQMVARFDADVTAHSPDVVVILTGRNDSTDATGALTLAGVQTLVAKVRGIGALPVVCIPLPTNVPDQKQRMATTANKLRLWTAASRVPVIDFYALATDLDGNLKAAFNTGDGIHPPNGGIKLMADHAHPIISALLPEPAPVTAIDRVDTDNLVKNPFFEGIDGSFTVGNWSRGATPAFASYSTVDVAGWKGKGLQIVTVPEATVVPDANIRQTLNIGTTAAVGDVIEWAGRVNVVSSTLPGTKNVMARILFETNGEIIAPLETSLPVAGTFRIRHTIPAGTTIIRQMFSVSPDAAGAVTVQFGEVSMRNLTKLGMS